MYQAVIVDDEPVIVSGIRDALDWEGFGFEIALATTSPATVLSFLSVHPVHLLITDKMCIRDRQKGMYHSEGIIRLIFRIRIRDDTDHFFPGHLKFIILIPHF